MRRPRERSWAAFCREANVVLSRSASRFADIASRTPSARACAPEALRRATILRASGANAAARARLLSRREQRHIVGAFGQPARDALRLHRQPRISLLDSLEQVGEIRGGI